MQVEIYKHNEDMVLKTAHKLKVSATQLVNMILENVEVEPRMEVTRVKMTFERKLLNSKVVTPVVVENFVEKWKE